MYYQFNLLKMISTSQKGLKENNLMKNTPITVQKAKSFLKNGTLYNKICILCLNMSDDLSTLDEMVHIDENDFSIGIILNTLFSKECSYEEDSQVKICLECLTKASIAYQFISSYKKSQNALHILKERSLELDKNSTLAEIAATSTLDLMTNNHCEINKEHNVNDNTTLQVYQCQCKKFFFQKQSYQLHKGIQSLDINSKVFSREDTDSVNELIKALIHDDSISICTFCLKMNGEMIILSKCIEVFENPEILNTMFILKEAITPFLILNNIASNSVCFNCLNDLLPAILLLKKCENKQNVIRICIDNLYNKATNIDLKHLSQVVKTEDRTLLLVATQLENFGSNISDLSISASYSEPRQSQLKYKSADESHICDMCGKTLRSRNNLKRHLKMHLPKILDCTACSLKFQTQELLDFHLRKFHGLGPKFICDYCGKECLNKCSVMRHIMYHHMTSECYLCKKVVRHLLYKRHLRVHKMKSEGNTSNTYLCEICDRLFESEDRLAQHKRLHSQSCDICKETFENPAKLYWHVRYAHKYKKCPICSKLITRAYYNKHILFHEGIKQKVKKNLECDFCGLVFETYALRRAHLKLLHGIQPAYSIVKYVCDICGTSRDGKGALANHIKSVHTSKDCNICKKTLKLGNYNAHMKRHMAPRPEKFFCEYCPKAFKQSVSLTAHMNNVHLNIRPYVCDICGRSYRTAPVLQTHKKLHLGLRPYECEICNMKLCNKQALKKHRRLHTGEKPYKCDFCEETFTSTTSRLQHTQKLHDKTTFECSYCKKSFSTRNVWRGHLSQVHKVLASDIKFGKIPVFDDLNETENEVLQYFVSL